MADASKYLVLAVLAAGIGLSAWQFVGPSGTSKGLTVDVKLPEFSTLAVEGKAAYDANCGACHGRHAAGTESGPPLVHDIYNPGHHADAAFVFAAQNGVRQHHWSYGNMPPQPQVSAQQIMSIVQYVRELQVANGIRFRSHRM